jgi:hypothetical protein
MWTRDKINALLIRSDKAVKTAMLRLYAAQTADEQAVTIVRHLNRRGFSVSTVGIGSRLARRIDAGYPLSEGELRTARKIALWHSRQLVDLANAKAHAAANPVLIAA